jgi:hypothetical protein
MATTRTTHFEWRYLPGGTVVHALPSANDPLALCGADVWDASNWRGTGSQAEYEQAAVLPQCRRCLRKVGKS